MSDGSIVVTAAQQARGIMKHLFKQIDRFDRLAGMEFIHSGEFRIAAPERSTMSGGSYRADVEKFYFFLKKVHQDCPTGELCGAAESAAH